MLSPIIVECRRPPIVLGSHCHSSNQHPCDCILLFQLQEANADLLKMPHLKVVRYNEEVQPSSYKTALPEAARGSELRNSLLLDFCGKLTMQKGFKHSRGHDEGEEVGDGYVQQLAAGLRETAHVPNESTRPEHDVKLLALESRP